MDTAQSPPETVDVAIIGAGPAGSTLASLLAMRGVSVALLDRDAFPRDKLCGEFLSYDALPVLERLGVMDDIDGRHGAPSIHHCRVVGARRMYDFDLPRPARGVSRLLLDELLLRTAARHGAHRLDGWTAAAIDRAGRTVSIAKGPHTRTIAARVTVGAWGRWGRFDTQLGRSFVKDRTHRNFGFKRHYFGVRTTESIELYSFNGGYLGVNAIEGGLTNICGLVHSSRLQGHKGRWDAFVDTIRLEQPRLEELYARHVPAQDNYLSSEPVVFRARSPVEGGVFMIGDASGVIDPLTGNGMAMAIQSALAVAPALLRILGAEGDRSAAEREYRRRHRALFARRLSWSRRTASILSRPRLLDAALAGLRSPAIGEFLLRRTRGAHDEVERMAERWFA